MSRYIDADKLAREFERHPDRWYFGRDVLREIGEAETVEPVTPRVMTLDEATIVTGKELWIEERGANGTYVAIFYGHDAEYKNYGYSIIGLEVPVSFYYENPYKCPIELKIYGKDWRCWTAKPSDNLRRATAWGD